MSLIEEALRQAQIKLQPQPPQTVMEPGPQAPPVPASPPTSVPTHAPVRPPRTQVRASAAGSGRKLPLLALMGVGIGLAGGCVIGAIWWWEATSPFASSSRGLFDLTGVIEGTGESLAIINGRVTRLGDSVDGATVLGITKNSATLRWRGQKVVLQTDR